MLQQVADLVIVDGPAEQLGSPLEQVELGDDAGRGDHLREWSRLEPDVEPNVLSILPLEVKYDRAIRAVDGALRELHLCGQAGVNGARLGLGELVGDRDASRCCAIEQLLAILGGELIGTIFVKLIKRHSYYDPDPSTMVVGARAAHANHLGELLTRSTPLPAPPHEQLVQDAEARAAARAQRANVADDIQTAAHAPTDLQKRIAAATRELHRIGHPRHRP